MASFSREQIEAFTSSVLTRIKNMNIHQLSLSYQAEHDRILVRINATTGEELRLWFTRRLTLNLWPALNHVVTEHTAQQALATTPMLGADAHSKKMLADFKKQETLRHANFKTPFREQPSALPLGDKPMLVTNMNIAPLPSGKLQLNIQGYPDGLKTQRGFQMALETTLVHAFIHLLEQALSKSQWFVIPGLNELTQAVTEADDAIVAADKPKYLN